MLKNIEIVPIKLLGLLERWDRTKSKSSTSLPILYLDVGDGVIALNEKEQAFFYQEEGQGIFEYVAPFRCRVCGEILFLSGSLEITETHERRMSSETYLSSTDQFTCSGCEQEIELSVLVTEYQHSWSCDVECKEAEMIFVEGFEEIASNRQAVRELKIVNELLEFRVSRQNTILESMAKKLSQLSAYLLLVEGADDEAVWSQLLYKSLVDMDKVTIVVYGEGGKGEAVKAAKMFRKKGLQTIPRKLIIDSDGERDKVILDLRKQDNNISKNEFHVLMRNEIESYLTDAEAIAKVLNEEASTVREFLGSLNLPDGKKKFDTILKHFGAQSKPEVKGLIARSLKEIPPELKEIIEEVRGHAGSKNQIEIADYSSDLDEST